MCPARYQMPFCTCRSPPCLRIRKPTTCTTILFMRPPFCDLLLAHRPYIKPPARVTLPSFRLLPPPPQPQPLPLAPVDRPGSSLFFFFFLVALAARPTTTPCSKILSTRSNLDAGTIVTQQQTLPWALGPCHTLHTNLPFPTFVTLGRITVLNVRPRPR